MDPKLYMTGVMPQFLLALVGWGIGRTACEVISRDSQVRRRREGVATIALLRMRVLVDLARVNFLYEG